MNSTPLHSYSMRKYHNEQTLNSPALHSNLDDHDICPFTYSISYSELNRQHQEQLTCSMFLILLLVSALPSILTAHNLYHVKPTPSTPCPNTTCHTLSEYVNGANHFFTANTTLVFLPGEHTLDGGILAVANIGRFAMLAEDSSASETTTSITCSNPGSFVLVNVSEVDIMALDFISCGTHPPVLSPIESHDDFITLMRELIVNLVHHDSSLAVYTSMEVACNSSEWQNTTCRVPTVMVSSVPKFRVLNCSVKSSYLPFFIDHSQTIFRDLKLENNTGDYGGGLSIVDSTVNLNSTFIIHNTAEVGGGGIHAQDSHIVFQNIIILKSNTATYGGGLIVFNSTINFEGDSIFIGNSGKISGGGVYANHSSHLVFQNVTVENNTAGSYGGGFFGEDSNINFKGDSIFIGNSAGEIGGGVYANDSSHLVFQNVRVENNTAAVYGGGFRVSDSSSVNFEGEKVVFINNTAYYGGGLFVYDSSGVNFDGENVGFINNTAVYGGGLFEYDNSTVNFDGGNVVFINNTADYGGGLFVFNGSINFDGGNVKFINNTADYGGGLFAFNSGVNFERKLATFIDNSAREFGGGILVVASASLTFNIDVIFHSNYARIGGAIYGDSCSIATSGNVSLLNNSAWYGGAMELDASQLNVNGNSSFVGNSADYSNGYGGAINSVRSNLTFNGSIAFINNTATYGGGLALSADSTMYLLPNNTHIYFERNDASRHGGAIFIQDDPFSYCITDPMANYFRGICFIQVVHCNYQTAYYRVLQPTVGQDRDVQLVFESNSAKEAGSVLYGGTLDRCGFCAGEKDLTIGAPFDTIASISDSPSDVSIISSSPFQICFCNDSHLDCSQRLTTYSISILGRHSQSQ